MDHAFALAEIMRADRDRWHVLGLVRDLHLPDCWVAAGFVRNAVWDHLQRSAHPPRDGDIDVIWFDCEKADRDADRQIESELRRIDPARTWSVKNQARMHERNGDLPYLSATDAMRYWPETATAVAARRTDHDTCEITSAFGLEDLFGLILRPTRAFAGEKKEIYQDRLRTKNWLESWPSLRIIDG